MADYFTQFSCMLDVGSAANAAAAAEIQNELEAELERDEATDLGFMLQAGADPGELILYSDGYGEPEHVVTFVLRCAERLNLSGLWGFTWALTCSRARPGAFGGGAQLFDLDRRQTIEGVDCRTWLQQRLSSTETATKTSVGLELAPGEPS